MNKTKNIFIMTLFQYFEKLQAFLISENESLTFNFGQVGHFEHFVFVQPMTFS